MPLHGGEVWVGMGGRVVWERWLCTWGKVRVTIKLAFCSSFRHILVVTDGLTACVSGVRGERGGQAAGPLPT